MILVRIFDMENGKIIPTVHCYTLKSLKAIIEAYPESYMPMLQYVFYKTCPDPDQNPFFNLPEIDKEELILQEVGADFSTDDPILQEAIAFCDKLYDTPTKRAYRGLKIFMDKIALFFENQSLSTGRDGSLAPMVAAAKNYSDLRASFKDVEKDYKDEIKELARGDSYTAYDQR
jgi:hypothetical protein